MVAAGSGVRLGNPHPKALLPIGGRPMLAHGLDALAAGGCGHAIVVAAPEEHGRFADALADAPLPWTLAGGGPTRSDSVRAGLAVLGQTPELDDARFVLVHDAARPLTPAAVVERVVERLRAGAVAVIPVVGVADTMRLLTGEGSQVVDRGSLRAVQTPQGFERSLLARAHAALGGGSVTDDAAAVEAIGATVELVAGSPESLKVTRPLDLVLAEAVWRSR